MTLSVFTSSIFFAVKVVIVFCAPIAAKIEHVAAILMRYEISPNSSGVNTLATYIQNIPAILFPIISPIPIAPIPLIESKPPSFLFLKLFILYIVNKTQKNRY